jgi:ABC-type transport system involved in cytochrome c biogenesis ATPase subunit
MRLRHLRLKNFRSYPSLDIELEDVTVVVGPNDSGKSSLLDAILCLLSPVNRHGEFWTLDEVKHPGYPDLPFGDVTIEGWFDDLGAAQKEAYGRFLEGDGVRLGVYFDEEEERQGPCVVLPQGHAWLSSQLVATGWANWSNEESVWVPLAMLEAELFLRGVREKRSLRPQVIHLPGPDRPPVDPLSLLRPFVAREVARALESWPDLAKLIDATVKKATYALSDALVPLAQEYLSPSSRIVVTNPGTVTSSGLAETVVGATHALGAYAEYRTLPVPMAWEPTETEVPDGAIPVGSLGSGGQRAVNLAILELYADPQFWEPSRPVMMLIEEPETGLHPLAQRRVAVALAGYRDKHGLQVFVTTHSPILINAAPGAILLVDRDENDPGRASRVRPARDLPEVAEHVGASPADVLLASRFVIVEGDTEVRVIPAWARLIGIDLDPGRVCLVPARGWSAAGATTRLIEAVYPGASICVLLDAGPDPESEKHKIERAHGDRVPVVLLPYDEIEKAYSWRAVELWLEQEKPSVAPRATSPSDVSKRLLNHLAKRSLGRTYRPDADGAVIAGFMEESELSGPLKSALIKCLAD